MSDVEVGDGEKMGDLEGDDWVSEAHECVFVWRGLGTWDIEGAGIVLNGRKDI